MFIIRDIRAQKRYKTDDRDEYISKAEDLLILLNKNDREEKSQYRKEEYDHFISFDHIQHIGAQIFITNGFRNIDPVCDRAKDQNGQTGVDQVKEIQSVWLFHLTLLLFF